MSRQNVLDLAFPPAYGRADFIADDSNSEALSWIERWPDWPGPALVLCAAPGCGKTHLLHIWAAGAGAAICDGGALADGIVGADRETVAIDNADDLAGDRAREETLFHIYNALARRRGSLLLTARTPPARWHLQLPDLASRLRAAAVAEIGPPSDQLLETIIAKLCSDRQLVLAPRVLHYVLARMERSADAARRIVAALDRQGLEAKAPVTLERARAVLAAEGTDG
jgi:chromosomal replication initiation ATPase DnaA